MGKTTPAGWCLLACLLFWIMVIGVCTAHAEKSLTFDCTPASDAILLATIQFTVGAERSSFDAPLVSTCGSGADKVTCTDPLSKTICFPDTLWPAGAFVAKAMVGNARASSEYSAPLNVPGIPTSPGLLRAITQ